jgi:hypothetical protein
MQIFLSKTTESWCRSIETSVLLACCSAQNSCTIRLECLYTQKQKQSWRLWTSVRDSVKIPRAHPPSDGVTEYGIIQLTARPSRLGKIWYGRSHVNYQMIDLCVWPTDLFKIMYCLMGRDTEFGGNYCLCLQVREVICATDLHPSIIWLIIAT